MPNRKHQLRQPKEIDVPDGVAGRILEGPQNDTGKDTEFRQLD